MSAVGHRRHPAGHVHLAAGRRVVTASIHGGVFMSCATMLRARASCRDAPSCPRSAAAEYSSSMLAFIIVSTEEPGLVAVELRVPRVVEPARELVGEVPVAGLVPRQRGRGQAEEDHAGQQAGDGRAHQRSQVRMIAFVKPRP